MKAIQKIKSKKESRLSEASAELKVANGEIKVSGPGSMRKG